jgi:hypothetical protein
VFTSHTKRGGHGRHTDARVDGMYEPAAHGVGTADPSEQNDPVGHSSVATAVPARHTYPAGHGIVAATLAARGHTRPGVHGAQSAILAPPVVFANLPLGHAIGVDDAASQ